MPPRPPPASTTGLMPLRMAGASVGWVHPQWLQRLLQPPTPWRLRIDAVELQTDRPTFASRSAALAFWADTARARWSLPGWRDERIVIRHGGRPLCGIERALLRPLGLPLRSVQANVWSRDGEAVRIWIARRARSKPVEPGKLDALVAGGIAGFDEPRSTLVRECAEEAGIGAALADRAQPVGSLDLSYGTEYDGLTALHREHITLFDLQLPADFRPVAVDGEHESIMALSAAQVRVSVQSEDWTREGAWSTLDLIERQGWSALD